MADLNKQGLELGIAQAVQQEADRITEQAISDAVAKFERDLRESILRQAVNVTNFYEMHRDRQNLVITVRHGAGK